jgi:hypothetical protein
MLLNTGYICNSKPFCLESNFKNIKKRENFLDAYAAVSTYEDRDNYVYVVKTTREIEDIRSMLKYFFERKSPFCINKNFKK